ncbi:hypothetical protein Y032_0011g1306 [Ancylostoma ceylanicum]|uniref:Thrombospondin type 1 domain protein n=1 Tax=Ancylostoma ceylanicum TaxID=53326 RepID=A0A016VE12_9BILA|nr:hypothetical protein Y032_0011g1306 [Ancylostoma ceylanicum]
MLVSAVAIGRAVICAVIFIEFQVSAIDLRFLERRIEPSTRSIIATTSTVITTPRKNCTVGVWSEWQEVLSCNAECGSCGSRVFRRKCSTSECPCKGDLRKEERCNIQVCDYPKPACCPPFKLMVIEGEFACGPQDENSIAAFAAQLRAKRLQTTKIPSRQVSKSATKDTKSVSRWKTTIAATVTTT